MSKLPQLKVKYPQFEDKSEHICEVDELWQIKYRFSHGDELPIMTQEQVEQDTYHFGYRADVVVMVEGRVVNSYEELVQLASQDDYKDREFLEVELLLAPIGGG